METKRIVRRAGPGWTSVVLQLVVIGAGLSIFGCASTKNEVPTVAPAASAEAAPSLEERWGVEVVALRLTGANYMLDFRYKVLDPEKAAELFVHANKPVLIHHSSGARLEVPRPAKTGPLRPTNPPQAGRIYFMFFSNPGVVRPGDEVTVKIGDFEADLVVE
jgi:hypothetical protein